MNSLSNLLLIGIVVMLLLAVGIIFFVMLYHRRMLRHQLEIRQINAQKQQELVQATIQSEERERMRIAGELHDDVGVTLSSVRLFLHTAARQPDAQIISQSCALLDDSIQKIRQLSHKLQPATLQYLGLRASLESLLETIGKAGKMQTGCTVAQLPATTDEVALSLYRIVQELVNNILKHAEASYMNLSGGTDGGRLRLTLRHDGVGLTNEQFETLTYKSGAIGLKNIVNRLAAIKGSIRFSHHPAQGYHIQVSAPLHKA